MGRFIVKMSKDCQKLFFFTTFPYMDPIFKHLSSITLNGGSYKQCLSFILASLPILNQPIGFCGSCQTLKTGFKNITTFFFLNKSKIIHIHGIKANVSVSVIPLFCIKFGRKGFFVTRLHFCMLFMIVLNALQSAIFLKR